MTYSYFAFSRDAAATYTGGWPDIALQWEGGVR